MIDGEVHPSAEYNLSSLHIQLADAGAGNKVREEGPYEIPGFERPLVKRGVNILFNAETTQSAIGALSTTPERQESAMDLDNTTAVHHYLRRHFRGRIGRVYLTLCEHDLGDRVGDAHAGVINPDWSDPAAVEGVPQAARVMGMIEVERIYWPHSEGIKTSRYRVLPVDVREVS